MRHARTARLAEAHSCLGRCVVCIGHVVNSGLAAAMMNVSATRRPDPGGDIAQHASSVHIANAVYLTGFIHLIPTGVADSSASCRFERGGCVTRREGIESITMRPEAGSVTSVASGPIRITDSLPPRGKSREHSKCPSSPRPPSPTCRASIPASGCLACWMGRASGRRFGSTVRRERARRRWWQAS